MAMESGDKEVIRVASRIVASIGNYLDDDMGITHMDRLERIIQKIVKDEMNLETKKQPDYSQFRKARFQENFQSRILRS